MGDYVDDRMGEGMGDYVHGWMGQRMGDCVHDWMGDYVHDWMGKHIGDYVHDGMGDCMTGRVTMCMIGWVNVWVTVHNWMCQRLGDVHD